MRHAHVYLLAIVLHHVGATARHEAYFWLDAPDGAAWLISPATYWIPLIALLFVWCVVDAKNRHIKLPFWVPLVVSLIFPIGVPYYYWRTYPRRAAFVQMGLFAIFMAVCVAALWVGKKLVDYYFLEVA
jgi:hypothetical protein